MAATLLAATPARAQEEVPFVVTPDRVTLEMLQLAAVGAADHVVDLGSGDGRIVIAAAKRFGATATGIEIVPDLVRRSRDQAQASGVADRVAFVEQDLFMADLRHATVVTMYLLPAVNLQLRSRLLGLAVGTRIVSHDWDLGDWTPDRTLTVDAPDKRIGRVKSSQVHLWIVPAQVDGLWCDAAASLRVNQRFQRFSATLMEPGNPAPTLVADGRIEGPNLVGQGTQEARLRLAGAVLRLQASGSQDGAAGRAFTRARGTTCDDVPTKSR